MAQHVVSPDGLLESASVLGCLVRPQAMRLVMTRPDTAMKGASVPVAEGQFRGGGVLQSASQQPEVKKGVL